MDRDEVLRVFVAAIEWLNGVRHADVFEQATTACEGKNVGLGVRQIFLWLMHVHDAGVVRWYVRRPPSDGFGYAKWDLGLKAPLSAVACLLKNQSTMGALFVLEGSLVSWRDVVDAELRAELSRLVAEKWKPKVRA